MKVVNRIQSAHPTIGYREMQQRFIKITIGGALL